MRVRWLDEALSDIDCIFDFIGIDNPDAALTETTRIMDTVKLLASNSNMGRAGRVHGTRELVIPGTPYIAAYRVKNDNIEILRIIHGARKWPDRF